MLRRSHLLLLRLHCCVLLLQPPHLLLVDLIEHGHHDDVVDDDDLKNIPIYDTGYMVQQQHVFVIEIPSTVMVMLVERISITNKGGLYMSEQ